MLVGHIGRLSMHVVQYKSCNVNAHHIYIYIYPVIIQNKGYTSRLALGRRVVSYVSRRWLQDLLLHEDLLLVLLLSGGHELHQLILYMHATMTQHLVF